MIDSFKEFISDRKLVIFGTGKAGEDVTNEIGTGLISYYVDNSSDKQGKAFMGKPVFGAETLLKEAKGSVYIIVASMYYEEISQQLKDMGFIEKDDFDHDCMVKFIGSNYFCPCCGGYFNKFQPYGLVPRENAMCPGCNSLERHRLLWSFISGNKELFQRKRNILHIAPEDILQKKIQAMHNVNYISVDLNSNLAMLKMDVTNTCFKDNYFDLIICNHVLEHITDDAKAMGELHRILAESGLAIITVPINKQLESTFEDPTITSYEARSKCYGQGDHVRTYGRDFIERLRKVGFSVSVYRVKEHYNDSIIKKYRLIEEDEIFLCRKSNE